MMTTTDALPSPQSRRDPRPVVYGYVHAGRPDEIEIAAWKKEIARYCREQDFRLETVFVDRRVPEDQIRRPGVRGALDVLVLPGVVGVVVPNLAHLPTHTGALATLRKLIEDTNSELLCIERET